MIREKIRGTISGWIVGPLLLAAIAVLIWVIVTSEGRPGRLVPAILGIVAAVALANKLARVCWRVWRDQRPFERRLAA